MTAKSRPHMQRRSALRVQQLDMFLHLVESESISITADRMCLTPSAVTKSLKELESQFGAVLFERTSRGLQITDSGRVMERYAESVVLGFESVISDIQSGGQHAMHDERIGHTPDVGQQLMVRLIGALRAEERDARLLLQMDEVEPLLERLRRGELDYAVMQAPTELDTDRFTCLPLGEESLSLAVRAEHPLQQGASLPEIHPKGLLTLPWVLPAIGSPACRGLKDSLLAMGLKFPLDVVHSSCPATILDLVLSLDLVTLLPASSLAPMVDKGLLRKLRAPFPMPRQSYSVVYLRPDAGEKQEDRLPIVRLLRLISDLRAVARGCDVAQRSDQRET